METARPHPGRRVAPAGVAALVVVLLVAAAPLRAEEPAAGAPKARAAAPAKQAAIRGQVFDSQTGKPVQGVTVVVVGPAGAAGRPPEQSRVTGADGVFQFTDLAAGGYTVRFSRPGYRDSSMKDVQVEPDKLSRADFPLPRPEPEQAEQPSTPAAGGGAPPGIEEFVVVGSVISMDSLALRVQSDQMLNVLSAQELSKFAASDVADALNRVSGVNVVKGQFAIIRGLEDRYSSTLYNGAPVPSPDPDKQSVQLDLFPSDIVSNLVVAKTFAPDLPSNSSGGSIDIITHDYPQTFDFKVSGGTGWNANSRQRFLGYVDGSPVGKDGKAPLESEYGVALGGRKDLLGHEVRFKTVFDQEVDYESRFGFQEGREPRQVKLKLFPKPAVITQSGDLSLGQLNLSDGRYDLTESERTAQTTAYGGLGFDLDPGGNHRIDGSVFWTKKSDETVQLRENGYLPDFDYTQLIVKTGIGFNDFAGFATPGSPIANSVRDDLNKQPSNGTAWFDSFLISNSFKHDRDLLLYQLNGDHEFRALDGLHATWAVNHARTTENEVARGARMFYEPFDLTQIPTVFPTTPASLGPGRYYAGKSIFLSSNGIEEKQDFGRIDAEYERDLLRWLGGKVSVGGWYEHARRNVVSSFLESPTVNGNTQIAIAGDTLLDLGQAIFPALDSQNGAPTGLRDTTNDSSREIWAVNANGKLTFFDKVDLLGGVRYESLLIKSNNDPFTGEFNPDGSPKIFPTAYLFFDRGDNSARPFELPTSTPPPPGTTFNDQILGIAVPVDPVTGLVDLVDRASIEALVNGKIDETRVLPAAGFAIRPLEGLALRGAWSETVARPSFREMGYYVSVEPATDDLIVGNPQLGLSDVESWDLRAEYTWGDRGDLVAVSGFYKTIQNPIESIVVRNPLNLDGSSSALFRTFFNNPNTARLRGVEAEARKSFGFLGLDFLRYLSVGGNFTYIDAKVDRTDIELERARSFFGTRPGDVPLFTSLNKSRRLFGQPQWIGNADLTFDHPDWGTRATVAFFAISDVLDAAGSATVIPDGSVLDLTLDRYIDSFYTLDVILSQAFHFDIPLPGEYSLPSAFTFKVSAKNLTDSTRRIVYDPAQTDHVIPERSYKVGRDYSFSLTYTLSF